MMIKPLFSIVTITLNNLDGLKNTHQSLKEQDCDDYEWIVIDGKSSDGTSDYLKIQNTPFISETDKGIYDAMNKGIDHTKSDYIIFMNAGDIFANAHVLSLIKKEIQNTKPDFIYGDALEIVDNKPVIKKARPHTKITQGMFTHHQAMIYKTAIIEHERYNLLYEVSADYGFTTRALKNSATVSYIPSPLCLFESGGLSQQRVFQGRKEQFLIRHAHKLPLWRNVIIFILQTALYRLRKLSPKLYWYLKR